MNLWINEANDCWCWMKTKGIGEARWPSATRNQFQSSLPNGKIELISFAAALAPKRMQSWRKSERIEQFLSFFGSEAWSAEQRYLLIAWALGLFLGGLEAATAAWQPAKKRDKRPRKSTNEAEEWEWNETLLLPWAAVQQLMKWIDGWSGEEDELNGAQPKEPKAPRQAKAKHKTIPFFAAGHGKPAKKWSCCFAAEGLFSFSFYFN